MKKNTIKTLICTALSIVTLGFSACSGGNDSISSSYEEPPTSDSSSQEETPVYTALTDADFLTASGNVLQNVAGETVQLRGTNFGGWLHLEGWMDGGGGDNNHRATITALRERFSEEQTQALLKIYQDAFITETDVDNVYNLGLNMVRVPFFWTEILNESGEVLPHAFEQLDWIIAKCKERGMYVLLDLHGSPGGHSAGWLTGGHTGSNELWTNATYQAWTVRIWEALATRYKDEPAVCGYGLLNEPVPPENSPITTAQMYDTLYQAVRAIDSKHAIFMGAFFNFDALGSPASNGWTNVVYETHHYDDGNKSAENQQNFVSGTLGYLHQYQMNWEVPVLAGEFNFWSAKEAWNAWLYTLNQEGISWSNWTYKHTDSNADNNWGLYYQPTVEAVDYETDSYEEIARKWRGYTTENYTKNPFLTEVFTGATKQETLQKIDCSAWTVTGHWTDGDNVTSNVFDGDLFTRWANGQVQGGANQWLEIDFGEETSFKRVDVYTASGDYTRSYRLYVYLDNEWRIITRGDGIFGLTQIDVEEVTTTKIRLTQTGRADWNHWSIYELAIFG